jgi:dihydropteroate synthase
MGGVGWPPDRPPTTGGEALTDAIAAAEAALRYNIRPLTGGAGRGIAAAPTGDPTRPGPLVANGDVVILEGLRPDEAAGLVAAVEAEGGRTSMAPDGERAVLAGPAGSLNLAATRLAELGPPAGELGGALTRALAGRGARTTLRCGDHRLLLGEATLIMGVVNVTPDSFSGDGLAGDVGAAVALAERLVGEGADIVDVGGESTRPGSSPVDAATELARVMPVVEALAARLGVPISVDTRKAEVARAAIGAGATLVNDIWGLRGDPQMAAVVAGHPEVALVAMHNRGGTTYADLVADISRDLHESLVIAARHGVAAERIVVDPGFGFGKTPAQNLELVQRLPELGGLGRPLLLGPSRKSTIGLLLGGAPPELRVEGTLALCVLAVAAGAEIVRVHDVGAIRRGLRVADAVLRDVPEEVRRAPVPGRTG